MKKGPGSVYDKWNIFVVICDTDTPYAGAAGMLLHINGKFTMEKLK